MLNVALCAGELIRFTDLIQDVVEVRVTEACVNNQGTPPLLEISPQRKKKEA